MLLVILAHLTKTKHFSDSELLELSAKVKDNITNDEPSSISINLGSNYLDVPFFSTLLYGSAQELRC